MKHALLAISLLAALASAALAQRPNVVLVITDDQGYGDLGAHGNAKIKTPNLDALHKESVRLTDYHVDPTCSPTRSALMSGRYSTRTGVWHTIMGRSLMATEEVTLAERFAANGYRTGMFGKWHLGTTPEEQGFDVAVEHKQLKGFKGHRGPTAPTWPTPPPWCQTTCSKPWSCGRHGALSPRCHLPNMPVR